MAIKPVKKMTKNIIMGKYVPLPAVMIEENNITNKTPLAITYGKNCSLVVITLPDVKLDERMQERISILVNEPLE